MPFAVVHAHLRMLPRLQARDQLRQAMVTAIGTGRLTKDDTQATLRQWDRVAHPAQRRRVPRATFADLERIGIQVVQVPAKAPARG
jgi:hypothetical protein